jgi:predicted amino acid-binding ACT domain protein
MKLKVTRTRVWRSAIDDRVGGTADRLEPLAQAGADFEFVFARRTPEMPGAGVIYVAPVTGSKVIAAARRAGFSQPTDIHFLRIEGADKAGLVAVITRALGDAGISFRGVSSAAIGNRAVSHVAFDTAADASKAARLLGKLA